MAKHSHGSMDISEQEKTFNGFVRWTVRTVVVIIVALILLALING
ncbi:aa3 type cytochrome c oxidase subunit IV [Palleronia salina]|uniref:Aa3 type cytochrome c oxidase subunit IV n=2 Tax=Palleronia TaxID=315422 RepID=A0A1M6KAG2_9RHOB|nr:MULTISPECIES: aa3-type cytochrome c oxidase subunit IV [Palleronia]SEN02268.1 aa3 type cytochrome c oxidase subunit IV [Palleronia pelagia]SHJ55928.1 aa3 type cytochrome c oxidase subunit IV [Palleronia salina]